MAIKNKTILIVDDDADLVAILTVRCKRLGFNTLSAHNLLSAVSQLDFQSPDLLCVDVGLETGNGLNFLELIQLDSKQNKFQRLY